MYVALSITAYDSETLTHLFLNLNYLLSTSIESGTYPHSCKKFKKRIVNTETINKTMFRVLLRISRLTEERR